MNHPSQCNGLLVHASTGWVSLYASTCKMCNLIMRSLRPASIQFFIQAVGAIHGLSRHRKMQKTCTVIQTWQGRNPDLRLFAWMCVRSASLRLFYHQFSCNLAVSSITTHSPLPWLRDSALALEPRCTSHAQKKNIETYYWYYSG